MRRKMMNELNEWKNNLDTKPLIIYGARQVGKTYLVREFAKEYYSNIFEINFEFESSAKSIFDGDLVVDELITKLTAYKIDVPIRGKKTLIFFDEVQKCPQVLTSLKAFALDGRFDVIASGSMLGISMHEVSSYPVGYVETLHMCPMDFEEFLWANGYNDDQIKYFKTFFDKGELVPEAIHGKLNNLFLKYVVVGGMPAVVKNFVENKDINKVVTIQRRILEDYKQDIAKYAITQIKEKVRDCYEAIPEQLAKENKKFQYKLVRQGGTARYYGASLNWISDSGIGFKVNRLKTFDIPLKAYRDLASFKFYFNDTGLLLAFYEENVQSEILNGNIGVFKGGIFENIVAQNLMSNKMPLYYYRRDDKLEIDFITLMNNKIIPIEVKSGKNTKSISLNNIVENEELEYAIKLSMNNVNCNNSKIKCYPLYMIMFIKNER